MVASNLPARDSAAVLALVDVSSQLQRRGEAMARRASLSTQQWLLLLHVAGEPGLPQRANGHDAHGILASEVASIRGVTQANISRLVASLATRGLVRQEGDSNDARRRRLVITGRGRKAVAQLEPYRQRANELLLSDLSRRERVQFMDFLHRCLQRLRLDPENAWHEGVKRSQERRAKPFASPRSRQLT